METKGIWDYCKAKLIGWEWKSLLCKKGLDIIWWDNGAD
jgi:hypothetical protein